MTDDNTVRKQFVCTNCSRLGHNFKYCKDPITSYGIVLVKTPTYSDVLAAPLARISYLINNFQFLMVSRKNSLGYVEFIRGRYKTDNLDQVIYLFQQMTQAEIDKFSTNSFDVLWKDFWLDKCEKSFVQDEYETSYRKYCILNDSHDLLKQTKPLYSIPEWGFPKGRKNSHETNLECAIREFYEETQISSDNIKLIDCKPFVEDLVGTNGVKYRHVYYLAELINDVVPRIDEKSCQKYEIGDIGFFDYNACLKLIRDYHIEKKEVVIDVLMYYIKKILKPGN